MGSGLDQVDDQTELHSSKREFQFNIWLKLINKESDVFWIGMTDQKKEGIYEWKSGRGGLSFDITKHWASGEPDGASDDCLLVQESILYDYDCSGSWFGACQKRKSKTSKYFQIAETKIVKQ